MARHLERRLRLHQLRVIDAIATHGSVLRASKALGLSQPALTRAVREMEEVVEAPLFARHARGMNATQAGLAVCATARRVLAEFSRLEDELDRHAMGASGIVAIGALPTAATGLLPAVLARLKLSHPALQVRLVQGRTEDLLPELASGGLDLVVGRLYPPAVEDGFVRETLYDEPLSVLARADHPVFRSGVVTAAALAVYDLVLPTVGQRVGQEIDRLLTQLDLHPRVSLRATSVGFIREMLFSTDYITIAPRMTLAGDLLRGTMRVVPLPVPTPGRPAGLILREGGTSVAAASLIGCLRATIAEMTGHGILTEAGI